MEQRRILGILSRYIILLIFALGNLKLIYIIFTPLTIYPVYWILSLIYDDVLLVQQNSLILSSIEIELVAACIAGSAYYLLFFLNLSTPMRKRQRILSLIFLISSFLIVNIIRIVSFSIFYAESLNVERIHVFFWYLVSTFLVVFIWFSSVKLFSVESLPVYTDLSFIMKSILPGKTKPKVFKLKNT
ncbi:pacearchaeosortase [Candidatus Pacearchaeota archaeon]|nr:pacearchaeosortase [Candidatus Pacearchaeota archaeon]